MLKLTLVRILIIQILKFTQNVKILKIGPNISINQWLARLSKIKIDEADEIWDFILNYVKMIIK